MNNYKMSEFIKFLNFKVVLFAMNSILSVRSSQIVTDVVVARAIPIADVALTGTPSATFTGISRIRCLAECSKMNCFSFNFGSEERRCELHGTYICDNQQTLSGRIGFKHYDVESGDFMQFADEYRGTSDCSLLGRCSPKCYLPTTSTTLTTTTQPPPTTHPPTTTTTIPPTTTTTPPPATTTASVPGPGEVNHVCTSNSDCTTASSDCRNSVICECVAGTGYHSPTKTCVPTCPGNYGNTFHKTADHGILNNNMLTFYGVDRAYCKQQCLGMEDCLSAEYDVILKECALSNVTKNNHLEAWREMFMMDYYERNCE